MNHEGDIAKRLKKIYGFRGDPYELVQGVARVAETVGERGVEFVPALDDLVDAVRASSGRARRADIDTVTDTVFSLFEGETV